VTANKGPLVIAFKELSNLAKKYERLFRYEATVAGALPDSEIVREALQGNQISSLKGILNGTTNYILTRMTFEDVSFEIALKEAQQMGIAEADSSYDVEGVDAASKLVILANSIMGDDVRLSDVKREGISHVTPEAIRLAELDGFLIKHIASIENGDLEVAPRLVEKTSSLAVGGTLNVLCFETDLAGEITLIGRGAGGVETSSAILGDILNIAKLRGHIKRID
jgi:homoserine dehydrogenase